ncbi:hypothetical protein MOC99_20025 [Bacillus haynesii]|uniref:hypothetical protein n=1 Tax=Bacillus haynesii TaxID=1925021 RepID=UPI00227F3077|nr:hypothetical protein [Bacillus haynesii]MCY7753162.1 hypothetical protein [Bacillus haynesii]MCY8352087.1 hypothetical protein [Bacillus haynesii]MEC0755037.1 hypothetical protein [Bacillus haynesii]
MFELLKKLMETNFWTLIVSIAKVISTLTFLLTSFGMFFWGIGYTFLYGYYFGGGVTDFSSILEMVIKIVPFNFYSVMIISLFVLCTVFFLFNIGLFIKAGKILNIALSFIFFVVLHVALTWIFIGDVTFQNLLYFSILWVIPLYIVIVTFYFYRTTKSSRFFSIFSGILTAIILCAILYNFILDETIRYLITVSICFLLSIIYSYFSLRNFFSILMLTLPYFFTVSIFVKIFLEKFMNIHSKSLFISLCLFSIILSSVYSYFYLKHRESSNTDSNNPLNNNTNNNSNHNNNNDSKKKKYLEIEMIDKIAKFLAPLEQPLRNIFIISAIICFLVGTPMVSSLSGKVIRVVTPTNAFKYEKIETPSLPEKKVEGILVSEQNNILYISSKNDFKLIRIKDESFKTQELQPK